MHIRAAVDWGRFSKLLWYLNQIYGTFIVESSWVKCIDNHFTWIIKIRPRQFIQICIDIKWIIGDKDYSVFFFISTFSQYIARSCSFDFQRIPQRFQECVTMTTNDGPVAQRHALYSIYVFRLFSSKHLIPRWRLWYGLSLRWIGSNPPFI